MIKEVKAEHWNVTVAVMVMYENILEMMREKNLSGELVQFNGENGCHVEGFRVSKDNVRFLEVKEFYSSYRSWQTCKEISVWIVGPNKNMYDYIRAIKLVPCTQEDYYTISHSVDKQGRAWTDSSRQGLDKLLMNGDKVVCRLKNGKNLHCVFVRKMKDGYFVATNASKLYGEDVEVRVKPESWAWESWFERRA